MKRSASALLDNDADGTAAAILLACMASTANTTNDGDTPIVHAEGQKDVKPTNEGRNDVPDGQWHIIGESSCDDTNTADEVVPQPTSAPKSPSVTRDPSHQNQPPTKSARIASAASEKSFLPGKHGVSVLSVPYDERKDSHHKYNSYITEATTSSSPMTSTPSSFKPLDCFKLASALATNSSSSSISSSGGPSSHRADSIDQPYQQHKVVDPSLPHSSNQQHQATASTAAPSNGTKADGITSAAVASSTVATSTLLGMEANLTQADEIRTTKLEKETERVMTQAFTNLSMKEQEKVHDELYGRGQGQGVGQQSISRPQPAEESSLLQQIDIELRQLSRHSNVDTAAYEHALSLSPRIVQDDESFKLIFLRAEGYDPLKAAQRIVRYFAGKLEIWGVSNLVDDITYDKLTNDDRKALLSGVYQIHPELRDKSERLISFLYETTRNSEREEPEFKSWKSRVSVC